MSYVTLLALPFKVNKIRCIALPFVALQTHQKQTAALRCLTRLFLRHFTRAPAHFQYFTHDQLLSRASREPGQGTTKMPTFLRQFPRAHL